VAIEWSLPVPYDWKPWKQCMLMFC
jgi:hypothetical protein